MFNSLTVQFAKHRLTCTMKLVPTHRPPAALPQPTKGWLFPCLGLMAFRELIALLLQAAALPPVSTGWDCGLLEYVTYDPAPSTSLPSEMQQHRQMNIPGSLHITGPGVCYSRHERRPESFTILPQIRFSLFYRLSSTYHSEVGGTPKPYAYRVWVG